MGVCQPRAQGWIVRVEDEAEAFRQTNQRQRKSRLLGAPRGSHCSRSLDQVIECHWDGGVPVQGHGNAFFSHEVRPLTATTLADHPRAPGRRASSSQGPSI